MKKILIFILTLLIFTSCWKEEVKENTIPFQTTKVLSRSIEIGKNYTAEVKSYESTLLSMETNGRVLFVWAKKWDSVKKWQLLAKIDTEEINGEYETISNIYWNLDLIIQHTLWTYESQIDSLASKKRQLEIILSWVNTEKKDTSSIHISSIENLKAQIDIGTKRVSLAETNLKMTIEWMNTEEKNIYNNIKNTITASIILDTTIIDFVDKILWYTPFSKEKNDSIDTYFWAKDILKKEKIKEDFITIYKLYKEYKNIYDEKIVPEKYSNDDLVMFIEKGIVFNESLRVFLWNFYTVTDNSIDNIFLTQQEIESYKNDIVNFWTSIEKLILSIDGNTTAWFKWITQWLEIFYEKRDKTKAILEKTLDIEKSSLEATKKTLTQTESIQYSENSKIKNSQELTWEQIIEIEKSITSLQQEKDTKIQELLLEKEKLHGNERKLNNIEKNSALYAPFDWVILESHIDIWTMIFPWTPVLEIANIKNIYLETNIPKEVLEDKKIGDIISFRRSGKETKTGTIEQIYTYLDEKNKNMTVEILPFNKENLTLRENVKVYFSKNSNTGSIIPNNSIVQKFSIPWIYTQSWNTLVFKNIQIEEQNDYESLVVWLKEWEEVVTQWKENVYDGYIIDTYIK